MNHTFTAFPQRAGGNIANFSGTISVDRAIEGLNTRITISGSNAVDATLNPAAPFEPATGNVVGMEDNYGMQANLGGPTYRGVVRDLVFDITGGTTLINQLGPFSFDPTAGSISHEIDNNGESFQFFDGLPASINGSSTPVALTNVGGLMQLTVPVDVDYTVPLSAFGVTLYANFTGQLVGQRGVVGDYDGNGSVGPEDYSIWQTTFGSTLDRSADGNDDGIVDAADYVVWRAQLGQIAPGEGGAAAVPELSAIASLATGCMTLSSLGSRWCQRPHTRRRQRST